MPVPGRYWGIGIAAAVLVHAAIAAFVFWQPAAPGAREAGLRGVEVRLGTAGRAPGSAVEAADSPETEAVSRTEPVADATPRETSAPQPESVMAEPVEETVMAEPETVGSQPVEETVTAEPETAGSQPVAEEEAAVAPPDSTAPRALDQATTPQPDAAPAREPDDAVDEAPPEKKLVATTEPAAAGAGGESGSRAAADSGSGEDTSGGGTPGVSADYMARLRAWLEKHKQYPRRAQIRRQEGTALLRFVVDREGRVLEYTIHESSGHEILDEEVVAMIERAQPMPGMPDEMRRGRLELVVPVQFLLM